MCTCYFHIKGQPSKRPRQEPGGGESSDDSGTVCNLSCTTLIKLTKNPVLRAANKQSLDEVFVISRIIKVKVGVIS